MECLLDTHTFLWFINGDKQLSEKAKNAIIDANAVKYISIASFWEIAIKVSLGKLKLDMAFSDLQEQVIQNGFEILPITFDHIQRLLSLDFHHHDPFDRIILAQGLEEHFTIITKDQHFPSYTDKVMWK